MAVDLDGLSSAMREIFAACRAEELKLDKILFSSKVSEWETPRYVFDCLDMGIGYNLDVAASAKNALCKKFYTAKANGLIQPWTGNVWCNPPYGRDLKNWVEKAIHEAEGKSYKCCTLLVPFRPDTKWFKLIYDYAMEHGGVVCTAIHGRLKFTLNGKPVGTATFPSCAITIWPGEVTTNRFDMRLIEIPKPK